MKLRRNAALSLVWPVRWDLKSWDAKRAGAARGPHSRAGVGTLLRPRGSTRGLRRYRELSAGGVSPWADPLADAASYGRLRPAAASRLHS
jgi:hypothetical protein